MSGISAWLHSPGRAVGLLLSRLFFYGFTAHHSVCTEGLCCGTDKTVNSLGRGLELGAAALYPESEKVTFFQRTNGVNVFGSIYPSYFFCGKKYLPLIFKRFQLGLFQV